MGQVCDLTGAVQTENSPACPSGLRNEYWIETQPPQDQAVVVQLQIDAWTGLIANDNCTSNIVTQTFYQCARRSRTGLLE